MLPFTKRPVRSDEAPKSVVTQDDAVVASSKRSVPPPSADALPSLRSPAPSAGDDDLTGIMDSRFAAGALAPNRIVPAAGRPASLAPSPRRPTLRQSPSSVLPPPSSPGRSETDSDRTMLRGAPKIVKKSRGSMTPPSGHTALLDSSRSPRRDNLIAGPPSDLLEDSADFTEVEGGRSDSGPHGHAMRGSPSQRPPISVEGPPSYPASSGYVSPPASSQRGRLGIDGLAPAASMPAHFMTAQAPYADPPGTAFTADNYRISSGRPGLSWAAALLACGLFVGVVAVAVVQNSDAVADTTAAFVDPARMPVKAPGGRPMSSTAFSLSANGIPAPDPATPAPPAGLLGVAAPSVSSPGTTERPSAATTPAAAQNAQPAAAAAPLNTVMGFAPVAVAPAAATPAKRPTTTWKPPPPAAAKAAPAKLVPDDEAPKKEAKAVIKTTKKAEPDEDTKKALEALQKAQLESSSSF